MKEDEEIKSSLSSPELMSKMNVHLLNIVQIDELLEQLKSVSKEVSDKVKEAYNSMEFGIGLFRQLYRLDSFIFYTN